MLINWAVITIYIMLYLIQRISANLGVWHRYRLQTVRSLAGVSLMLRLLWACLRWDDMAVKPVPATGTTRTGECTYQSAMVVLLVVVVIMLLWYLIHSNMAIFRRETEGKVRNLIISVTETSDTEITTTEIIKRRDVGPYSIRSEYCIRKIICPIGVPDTPKGTSAQTYLNGILKN